MKDLAQTLQSLITGVVITAAALSVAPDTFAGEPSFTITRLVGDGDSLQPHGNVSNVNDIYVNNNGEWIADVTLTGGTSARAIVKNGTVWLAQGDTLGTQTVSSVANLLKHLNNNGDVTFRPTLSTAPTSGIYFNMTRLVAVGDVSSAPQFSPSTAYTGFFRARSTDAGDVLVVASVDDPVIPTTTDRALVWLSYDPKTQIVTESVLFKEGDAAPGAGLGVTFSDFATDADNHALNSNGELIFIGDYAGATTADNAGIYIDTNLVLRKGSASPIAGSNYSGIASSRVHFNASRQYVFTSLIDNAVTGANNVIGLGNGNAVNDTLIYRRQGDSAPGLTETISSLGTGVQPHITNAGDIFWYAQLGGGLATENQALFRNDTLLLKKGVTQVSGQTITTVLGTTSTSNGIGSTLVVSPNGRFAITRSVVNSGPRVVLLFEFEEEKPPCAGPADFNCDNLVNVDDLLTLLQGWGDCVKGDPCPTDIAPPEGDGVTNVDDLLLLLQSWT